MKNKNIKDELEEGKLSKIAGGAGIMEKMFGPSKEKKLSMQKASEAQLAKEKAFNRRENERMLREYEEEEDQRRAFELNMDGEG